MRRTRAREAVLAALDSTGRPMTRQEIATKTTPGDIDKVTMYRTLTALTGAGLLHTVLDADGVARFCVNRAARGCPGGHAHFQCLECGEMRCIHEQRVPRISIRGVAVVKTKQLVAYGVCSRCANTMRRQASRTCRRENMR